MRSIFAIEYRTVGGSWHRLVGRQAWTLQQLHGAGERGCATIERPAPRWSGYVAELRHRGLVIETVHEKHGGPFPGRHGRYVLRSDVELREVA